MKLAGCNFPASKLPNPFGLFDMCGNVDEMTHPCEIGTKKIIPKVESIVGMNNSWEQNEVNYTTNALHSHRSLPGYLQVGFE